MSLMKTLEIPKSGKCGGTVWQRNRFCQYSYPAFVPFNPRTPAQVTVRGTFGAVSKRWRTLTQEQRDAWIAVARTIKSKPRLFQCGALTGCQLFVKRNVSLVNQGKPQVDLPTEGRSKNEECRNMTPKAVPGLLGGVFVSKRDTGREFPECRRWRFEPLSRRRGTSNMPHPTSNTQWQPFAQSMNVGSSMLDVGCSQTSWGGGTPLRYRSSTVVPPYHHRSSTLAGRWVRRCPQKRLRFPCRSQSRGCLLL